MLGKMQWPWNGDMGKRDRRVPNSCDEKTIWIREEASEMGASSLRFKVWKTETVTGNFFLNS